MRIQLAARVAGAVAAFLLSVGCHLRDRTPPVARVSVAAIASLDSCDRTVDAPASGATAARSTPSRPRRSRGVVRQFPSFSLFIPDSVGVELPDNARGRVHLAWPNCEACRFDVTIQADSGVNLETRIARIVAEQHRIDSVNHDPNTGIGEFDEIDGPPVAITIPGGRGYLIDNDCGDCAAMELQLGRAGKLASVTFGGDDDMPEPARHLCEMTVVAKTFAWRE